MIISVSNKQLLSYIIWSFVIIFSTIFLFHSQHYIASLILYAFNIIISAFAIFYTYKNRDLLLFNPVFVILYSSLFYYTFIGMFCLSSYNFIYNKISILELPTYTNDIFFITTSFVIFMTLISILLPTFISYIFKLKHKLNIKFLMKNYDEQKICKYLYCSFVVLIILYFLLCFATGYTPITAILNPAEFRSACFVDMGNVVNTFYQPLFVLNLCITIQLAVLRDIKTKAFKIYLILFSLYCLFWGVLSGGRSWFVTYIVYYFVVYSFKANIKINFKQILKVSLILIFLILFIGIYGNYRVQRTQIRKGSIGGAKTYTSIQQTLRRVDTYSSCLFFLYYIHQHKTNQNIFEYNDFKLKDIAATQLVQLIPRRFFPSKLDDTNGEITMRVFPKVYQEGIHIVFGGISVLFYEGGFFWLLFNACILGYILALFQFNIKKYYKYDVFIPFYQLFFVDLITTVYCLGVMNSTQSIKFPFKFILYIIVMYFVAEKRIRISVKL